MTPNVGSPANLIRTPHERAIQPMTFHTYFKMWGYILFMLAIWPMMGFVYAGNYLRRKVFG